LIRPSGHCSFALQSLDGLGPTAEVVKPRRSIELLDNRPVDEPFRDRRSTWEVANNRWPIGHVEHFFAPNSFDHDTYTLTFFRGGHTHFLGVA